MRGEKAKMHKSFIYSLIVGWLIILTSASVMGQEKEGSILISVRDVETGYALPAFISILKVEKDGSTGPVIDSFHMPLDREVLKSYPVGMYVIQVTLEGYQPMKSWFVIEADKKTVDRFMLSPVESPEDLEKKIRKSQLEKLSILPNMAVISGYVTDDETGQPLEKVCIVFEKTGIEAYSDQKGYFKASIPVKESLRFNDEEIKALEENIVFSLVGYKTLKEINVLIIANRYLKKNITMFKGEGEIIHDRTHPMLLRPERKSEKTNTIDHFSSSIPIDMEGSEEELFSLASSDQIIIKQPPSSIRVGFSSTWGYCCYPSECTNSITYSLEDYVRLGWGDEWIPSWGVHALRAGAVAYRSYGAYHVFNPRGSNHDICSSSCCQVFNSDNEGLTPKKTAGIMLQKGSSIFFAEYSAENNCLYSSYCSNTDLSCGNCYVGSPTNGWPCLYDSVGCGQYCNGHGRGMSQWGTYRWDLQGETWVWMVNHYYNANNGVDGPASGNRTAYITSPLEIISATPTPNSVSPGQTFQININANNYAGLAHEQIIIGGSLYSSGTSYIDDPTNDKKVILYTGNNNVSRFFQVPIGTPEGTYDLLVALWLDVDENNQIGSTDLAMHSYRLYSAITIGCPAPPAPSSITVPSSDCDGAYTVSWSSVSGATSYELQRATNSSFTDATTIYTGSSTSYNESGRPVGSYWYRVRASNSCGTSDWTSGGPCVVGSAPGVPSLISPSNGATGVSITPTLDWSDVSGATSYDVQVCSDSGCTSVVRSSNVSSSHWTVSPALNSGTTYYWRARANNSCGSGLWSSIWSFTTQGGIILTSPNGGETWPIGSNQAIRWTSNGVSGYVKIDLSPDGGVSWSTLFRRTSNDGVQNWIVTGPVTTQARIRVSSVKDPIVWDISDANFEIGVGTIPSVWDNQ